MPKRPRARNGVETNATAPSNDIVAQEPTNDANNNEEEESNELNCPVCMEPCWNPVLAVPCTHMGCQECMEQLTACPLCRTRLLDLLPCSDALRERAHGMPTSCTTCAWHGTRREQRDANHEECPEEGVRLALALATPVSSCLGDRREARSSRSRTPRAAATLSLEGICECILSILELRDATAVLNGLFNLAHRTFGRGCFRNTHAKWAMTILHSAVETAELRRALVQFDVLGDVLAAAGEAFSTEKSHWARRMTCLAVGDVVDWPCLRALRRSGIDFNEPALRYERTVLQELVSRGSLLPVELAVRQLGCDVNAAPVSRTETALMVAACEDLPMCVERLLELGALPDGNSPVGVEPTPLFNAASCGHLECVKALVGAKANLEVRVGGIGGTPLFVAAQRGHLAVVKVLVEQGANTEAALLSDGATPLYIAAQRGHTDVVKYLHEQGASLLPRVGPPQMNAAVAAITHGHVDTASYLVDLGLSVKEMLADGSTALYIAARYGYVEAVRYLLVQRVDPNIKCDKHDYTALHHACLFGHLDVVKELAEHGADLHIRAGNGRNAVGAAAWEGHVNVLRFLLDRNVSFDSCEPTVPSPVFLAAQENYPECIQLLASHGANVNQVLEPHKITPLLIACLEGSTTCVALLLSLGADAGAKAAKGLTPLLAAAAGGRRDIVEILLQHISEENCTASVLTASENDSGMSALYIAAHFGHTEVVRCLAKFGANVNAQASDGRSPVFAAALEDHADTVHELVSLGADVNLRDGSGAAPLVIATMHKKVASVFQLLEGGADVDYQTPGGGSTPLIVAVGNEDPSEELVEMLLKRNPNVLLRTHGGHTAVLVAAQYGHSTLLRRVAERVPRDTEDGAECLQEAFEAAVSGGNVACITALMDLGVNVQAEDDQGRSLLLQSIEANELPVAKALMKHGATCCCSADKSGAKVLSLAQRCEDPEMLAYLTRSAAQECCASASAKGRRTTKTSAPQTKRKATATTRPRGDTKRKRK